jgi:phospholipid/cholesterol/gamma-HCH transport system permease protein
MFVRFIQGIGERTINNFFSIKEELQFIFICFVHMFNPRSYNSAMKMVLVKQIYFTAIGIIPIFIMMAVIFGSIIIGVVIVLATEYNLQDKIGSIIITFVIDEFSPFFTALLISLRSSTAVNTEIVVMNINKELNTLREYGIDLVNYLFLPRIISGIISVTSLSMIFASLMLTSGYLFALFYMNMDIYAYRDLLVNAVEVEDLVILLLKGVAFGFVSMLIPIYSGLKAKGGNTAIPISVLNGMVKLFIAIFFIEVLSLLIQSL